MQEYSDLQLELQRIQKALNQLNAVLSQSEYQALCGDLIAHRNRIYERLKAGGWPTGLNTGSLAYNLNHRAPKKLFAAWTEFINRGEVGDGVQPMIAASWKRCYARVNPMQGVRTVHLNQAHLLTSQSASFMLLSIARPIIEDVYQYIEGSAVAFLLVNSAGCLLDRMGNGDVIAWLDRWNVTPGVILTEELVGTNAVGLALTERTGVEVYGAEHYLHALHQLAGAAAPIFDLSGRLLGVLGAFVIVDRYHKNYLGMVSAAARAIEAQLQADFLLSEQNSQLAQLNSILSTISDGILVWNASRILQHANPAAGEILALDIKSLLGRSVGSLFRFPSFIQQAIEHHKPLSNVEVSIGYGSRTITCMVNLDYVLNQGQLLWIIVTLHTEKQGRAGLVEQVGWGAPMLLDDIVGDSPQMQQVRNFARSAARARSSVLIRGETGTGKNTLANAIHNISPRREGPFVILACSALPADVLMRELLGYEEVGEGRRPTARPGKFELARGGTLFLQDADSLPMEAQAALINAVETGVITPIGSQRSVEIDVRVVASTQMDIEKLVAQGAYRADLYYWLSTLMVTLPPLRERRRDIMPVAERILKNVSKQLSMPKITFEPGVIEVFKTYPWPGNIRELEAVLGRATAMLGNGSVITLGMISPTVRYALHSTPPLNETPAPPAQSLMDIERQTILRTAQLCRGNVTLMAQTLDISRTTLWRRMREFGIYPKDYRHTKSSAYLKN